ncbi:MAG TPA: EVE domain-containing protein [Geobacteraceae bacterium]|nr:EVE domain-containing protein [Geobacteraceae bacterium]
MAYWLFKSEPGCFSFEDLHGRPHMTEQWDGVRNYQARNYLRDVVRPGDFVLFYHSNIPQPAVVGIAEVVRGGYPDHTAFDPSSEHFDPRSSPASPTWYMVDVRYVSSLPKPVTLENIRGNPLLAAMPLVNRSRLSIQPVSAEEWRIILAMGGMKSGLSSAAEGEGAGGERKTP